MTGEEEKKKLEMGTRTQSFGGRLGLAGYLRYLRHVPKGKGDVGKGAGTHAQTHTHTPVTTHTQHPQNLGIGLSNHNLKK
jgi:hypothetical protein